jgi:hypothetical protein
LEVDEVLPNILRIIMRAIAIIGIVILLASILLEMIPVFSNGVNEVVNAIHVTNQQPALAERITKDALLLTQPGDHSQAILELQVSLPVFEKNQMGLMKNDPSLQLPDHIPGDVSLLLVQAQPDYVAIDSAARSILQNADPPVDQNQLAIIEQHERPYFLEMSFVAQTWQGHIIGNAITFFWTELWMSTGVAFLLLLWAVLPALIRLFIHLFFLFVHRKEQTS